MRLSSLRKRLTLWRFRHILPKEMHEKLQNLFDTQPPEVVRETLIGLRAIQAISNLPNRDEAAIGLGVSLITGTMESEIAKNSGLMFRTPTELIRVLARHDVGEGRSPELQTALLIALGLAVCTAAGLVAAEQHPEKDIEDLNPAKFAAFLSEQLETADNIWPTLVEAFRASQNLKDGTGDQEQTPISREDVAALEELFNLPPAANDSAA